MRLSTKWLLAVVLLCNTLTIASQDANVSNFSWQNLPPIPDAEGFAGAIVGVCNNNALIIAGGSNFPEAKPWDGGKKVFYNNIFALTKSENQYKWNNLGTLKNNIAYSASVSTDWGVVSIGGGDGQNCFSDCLLLTYSDGKVEQKQLPALPNPSWFGLATIADGVIYYAGGQNSPDGNSTSEFLSFDLKSFMAGAKVDWQQMPALPGQSRVLAVMAAQTDGFGKNIYVISGRNLKKAEDGNLTPTFLKDGYRFDLRTKTWSQIADAPVSVCAAPSIASGQSNIIVFGGDSGSLSGQTLKENHPGFSKDILTYNTITNTWFKTGTLPVSQVTTSAVMFDGSMVIPCGEIKPGIRTPVISSCKLIAAKRSFGVINYIVLAIYLAFVLGIGLFFSDQKNTNDFFLAGKSIPWWAASLSIFGTQLSSITFMAIPAKTFSADWTYFMINMAVILIAAPIVCLVYIPFYRRLDVTTAYEYLEKRFNVIVRLLASLMFTLLMIGRMGIVIFLPAIAITTVTDVNINFSILAMGILCTVYTFMGGTKAVIWTDVMQVIVLLGGALVSLLLIIHQVDGGLAKIISVGAANAKFSIAYNGLDLTRTTWMVIFLGMFSVLIPYSSDQAVIQRYLTTKDEKTAKKSMWSNALLVIPSTILFFAIGTALYVYYKQNPAGMNMSLKTDSVFPWYIMESLPIGVSGVLIAGIFAAAQSTLSGSMNSVSAAVITDFYRRFWPNHSEAKYLLAARLVTVFLGVLSTAMALFMVKSSIISLWDAFTEIIGLIGGALAGLFVLGAFSKRANGKGALIAAAITIVILYYVQNYTHLHFFVYASIGLASCFVFGNIFSVFFKPASNEQLDGLTIYSLLQKK
ncbi:MAG: sodium/solute symporter [Phycisphaerales bacterium]